MVDTEEKLFWSKELLKEKDINQHQVTEITTQSNTNLQFFKFCQPPESSIAYTVQPVLGQFPMKVHF